ncbi:MAG: hypothetical protein U5L01_12830 [Rheinheimera sp.]|nr:hypothetical protein [Rheinheimera sp.]
MLGIEQMVYVDAALREGVLYEMSDRLQHHDIRTHTIQSLIKRYAVDLEQANRVNQAAQRIFNQVKADWHLDESWAELLQFAASVYEIGLQINSSSVQRHSAYILNNSNLPGFNQEQQRLLACLVRFHRRKIKVDDIPQFYLFSNVEFHRVLCIFRMAVLLNQKRRDDLTPDIELKAQASQLTLLLSEEWYQQHSVLAADLAAEQQYLRRIDVQLDCPGLPQDSIEELT